VSLLLYPAIVAICAGTGQVVDAASALLLGLRRLGALIGISFVTFIALLLAALFLLPLFALATLGAWERVVAIVLAVLIGGLIAAFFMGYLSIAEVYLVLESRSPFDALRTSMVRSAATGRWRLAALGASITALWFLPFLSVAVIPSGTRLGSALSAFVVVLLTAALSAYVNAVSTVAALDYRNRSRGDDLALALKEAAPA
jgi:hypothetical protein